MVKKPDKKPDKKPGKKSKQVPETLPETAPNIAPGKRQDKKIYIAVFLLVLLGIGCAVIWGIPYFIASQHAPAPGTAGSSKVTVYYFYGAECPHCHNVTPYVESLSQKYPDVNFQILETWHNENNNALSNLLNHNLNQTQYGVPEAIVGDVVLLGEDEITKKLEGVILDQKRNLTDPSGPAVTLSPVMRTGSNATITATYFYGNGCVHCEAVEPLIEDIQARYPELQLERLEVKENQTNLEKFLAMRDQYGLDSVTTPTIFIGEYALVGETEVKDHFEEKVLAEKQKLQGEGSTPVLTPAAGLTAAGNVSVDAVYFYGESCSHCENVKPVIANISSRYPDLNLTWLEVNYNADNRQQLIDMSSRYGIPNPGVPTIFIGNHVLIGEGDIMNRFESEVIAEQQRIASGAPANPLNLTPANVSKPETSVLSPYMVVFAALVDSTNPCGLSVLVFLLISMAAAGNRKRILMVGGVYIAAMFLFHLLVGIGLFSALSISGLAKPFSIIGGAVALILGIVTLADVLRNKETFLLSIPESRKGMLGTYIRKATLPAAFILGILAGVLGFSCTGGIYISILGLMGRNMTFMAGLPWLILYNLVFVLPLVLITLLFAYGISPARAELWRSEHKRMVRVVIGAIMVALGLVILAGWFG